MSYINSPNMNLPVPVVGSEAGPQYATDVNNSLNIIDQHNHSPGSGVQITPNGLNINTALTFANNFATNLAGLTLTAQSVTPANSTIYQSGVDLYFTDGLGNNIRITQSGAVAGTPGSIANLTSPASASYVSASKTFVFESDTSIAANLDAASILLRNISPNSTNAVTLAPPAALGSNYTVTLPALPASQKIMTLDSSGQMAAPYVVDNSTIVITSNTIQIGTLAANSVNTIQIADGAVTNAKLAALNYALSSSSGAYTSGPVGQTQITNMTATITTAGRPVLITAIADGTSSASMGVVNGGASLYVVRGSTTIAQYSMSSFQNSGVVTPVSAFSFIDFPAAGTYTYKLQHDSSGSSFTFSFGKLLVREI